MYTESMLNECHTQCYMQGTKERKRKGRLRILCIDNINEDMSSHGLTLKEALDLTNYQEQWRSFNCTYHCQITGGWNWSWWWWWRKSPSYGAPVNAWIRAGHWGVLKENAASFGIWPVLLYFNKKKHYCGWNAMYIAWQTMFSASHTTGFWTTWN